MATVKDKARPESIVDPHIPNKANRGSMLSIADGITAPVADATNALIYVDSADGDLKVRFKDNTTKVIVADT